MIEPAGPHAEPLLDAFVGAWCGRDPGAFATSCAVDLHYEDPFLGAPLDSPHALGTHAETLWAGFPDARMEATGPPMANGRLVTAPVKVLGTHTGDLLDLPPTKRFVVVQAVLVCELDPAGEALFRVRAFCDAYGAAQALGLVPRPGTLGARALSALQGFGLTGRR